MIKSLNIKNFILIDELSLDLTDGFTVLTGETGAGKSILLNSIDVALGAKTSKELIKKDEKSAIIEITFNINPENAALINILKGNGIELFDNELVVSKEISQSASRSRVNGVLVTQDFVKILREFLIDIHTQHQSYIYLQPKYHIDLLDRYGDATHKDLIKSFTENYEIYIETKKQLDKIKQFNENTQAQIDFLKFQIDEIEKAEIEDENEDKRLDEELTILTNAGDLKQMASSVYYSLSENENAILSQLNYLKSSINKYADVDKEIEQYGLEIENSIDILRDLSSNIRNYSERMEIDEEKITEIQNRIGVLENLKRKYGHTLENVIDNYKKFCEELNLIENGQQNQEELEQKEKIYFEKISETAKVISKNRLTLAKDLSQILTKELEKLELPKVRFEIKVEETELNNKGSNKVEFMISTNVSEDIKPLIKVASGGEISRVMLALKTIFAKADMIESVIFDEIDTGISGVASQMVAEEIKELSKTHQVICITHQPIIAAKADNHLYVVKKQEDKTDINVFELSETERLHAIAMLASGNDDEKSIEFAKQLISGNSL